jgi:crotonobetainyl-CoA:carnitine CoA-transferase CaiB-like acyl-CoA transferase
VNPRLIVLRLTGFGQTGPYSHRPGFARVFEAMSGFANLTGEASGSPQHMNFPLGDAAAGLFGAFSIVSAVVEQQRLPQAPGREIDLSATEALIRLLEPLAIEYEQLGLVRQRAGSRATYTAPSNVYKTQDGRWLTIVGSSDVTFRRLCLAMAQPELAADVRYCSNVARVTHLNALDDLIAQWCASQDLASLALTLDEHQVPFSKVYDVSDIYEDPHFKDRGVMMRLPDPDLGSVPAPCVVPRFVGFTSPTPRTGPAVGEHNTQVYGGLGLEAAELAKLRALKVI